MAVWGTSTPSSYRQPEPRRGFLLHDPHWHGAAGIDEAALRAWLQSSIATYSHVLTEGYQGAIHLYREGDRQLVVKVPGGRGPMRWLRRLMPRHEYRVYRRLESFAGAPRCHGLLDGESLVLDYVDGVRYRHAEIVDRERFFAELLELIRELHRRGVAHGDLKKKDNLLVVEGVHPCILDFGTAVIAKPGFAPFNRFFFRTFRQFDYNAWVKLKYNNDFSLLTPEDAALYRRTRLERITGTVKQTLLRLRWPEFVPPRVHRPPDPDKLGRGKAPGPQTLRQVSLEALRWLSGLLLIPTLAHRLRRRPPKERVAFGQPVLLQTFDRKLVSFAAHGSLAATSGSVREGEAFEVEPAPGSSATCLSFGSSIVLRSRTRARYLRVDGGAGNQVTVSSRTADEAEVLTLVRSRQEAAGVEDEQIRFGDAFALQTSNGRYFCYVADRSGELTSTPELFHDWGIFYFANPPAGGEDPSSDVG